MLKCSIKSKDINKINAVFEEIYYEYGHLIGFVISKYVSNKQDIEELINDVFLSFFNHIDKIKIKNIKSYLAITARNKAINHYKKNKKDILINPEIIDKKTSSDNTLYYIIIDDMRKILSDFEITIIIEHVVLGKSFKEIAQDNNKPISTISDQYYNAIKKYKIGEINENRR
jgi:RNA polymerase sigma-70 factor (ECF subfamily)